MSNRYLPMSNRYLEISFRWKSPLFFVERQWNVQSSKEMLQAAAGLCNSTVAVGCMEVHEVLSLNFRVFKASCQPQTQASKYKLHTSYHCSSCLGSQFSAGADFSTTKVNKGQADENSTSSSKLKQAKDYFSEISAI